MMATEDEPMFDVEPTNVTVGRRVTVQTIWGDEPGYVSDIQHGMAKVLLTESGDVAYISVARLVCDE